jgi:hypothetical protein
MKNQPDYGIDAPGVTAEYEKAFRAAGLKTERTFPNIFKTFPPLRIVTARK